MKQTIRLSLLLLMLVAVFSCSNSPSPSSVTEKAMNDLFKGNYEAFIDVCDLGADTIPPEKLQLVRERALGWLEKAFNDIKNNKNEKIRNQMPVSCKVIDEKEEGDNAVVEIEVTTAGEEVNNMKIFFKKDKSDEWKIQNNTELMYLPLLFAQ